MTVLDAGVIIGFLDSSDPHHEKAHRAIGDALDRGDRLAMPASVFAEILVGPSRRGRTAVAEVRAFVARVPIGIEPLDEEIAVAAAEIRSRHRALKLPDALVIATAGHLRADHLITTDRGWPSRSKLRLTTSVHHI